MKNSVETVVLLSKKHVNQKVMQEIELEYVAFRRTNMSNDYEKVIDELIEQTKGILKNNLIGIYLHGSAAMECFNPAKSDIDLIIIVKDNMPKKIKRGLMDCIVELNDRAPDKGLEISVVLQSVCNPFVYPTPFELHFSPMHLKWYMDNPDDYIQKMNGEDKDLAAHFTVITHRGKCLIGLPINEVFGQVPQECYMDSIWEDVKDAEEDIIDNPMYLVLNLARVLAYKSESLVLSKKEGGMWALDNLPIEYKELVSVAMTDYENESSTEYDSENLMKYAKYMLQQIKS